MVSIYRILLPNSSLCVIITSSDAAENEKPYIYSKLEIQGVPKTLMLRAVHFVLHGEVRLKVQQNCIYTSHKYSDIKRLWV